MPTPGQAAERCPGAETTLALRECLGRLLQESDQALAAALNTVAAQAAKEDEGPFLQAWRDAMDKVAGSADPNRQFRTFQRQRRQICRYAHSLSLQGSGYGVFVMSCELDLNDTVMQQFRL